jgi:hypothetical protein
MFGGIGLAVLFGLGCLLPYHF